MPDRARVEEFFDEYRRTFASFDVPAIGALFAFPVHVTSEADGVTVTSVATIEEWLPLIDRIVRAYQLLGVAEATPLSVQTVRVTPRILHAIVHWALGQADGKPVYEFTESYTLATTGDGIRIVALAHDETPRLLAAVARARTA
jgi:hypothetical protein